MPDDQDRHTPERPDETGELTPVTGPGEPSTERPPAPSEPEDIELDPTEHPAVVADEPRRGGTTTVVAMGILGVLVILGVAADPYTFTAIEELIGFGLVIFGVVEFSSYVRGRAIPVLYLQPIGAIVAGTILIIWPQQTTIIAALVLAVVLLLRGLQDVWAGIRRWHETGANTWSAIRGLILIVLGMIVVLFPSQSIVLVVIGGAVVAVARAVIAIWYLLAHRDGSRTMDPSETFAIVSAWLSQREMDAVAADDLENRVFLHRRAPRERLSRFAVLMFLATAIATFGIATNSTAVVIGAMLVAPLMTPILGTAAGLINGRTRSTAISAAVVVLGATFAVSVAWLLSALIPDLEAVVQNSQVTTRTSPSLLDLAIAIAAGAAGAYGVSRAESTDALPGVAVAIALVPPLAVVGITLHAGDLGQATGALLLFLTNLFSIVLMAGIVFVLVGYGSWGRLYHRRDRIRVSFALVLFGIILISIPLALSARTVFQESADLRSASAAVSEWLGDDTRLRIVAISVDGDEVTVELIGPVAPPIPEALAADLTDRIGRPVGAVVRWVEETETSSFLR